MTDFYTLSRRSLLFVPALKSRYIHKAVTVPSDVVILDLEASIADPYKEEARKSLAKSIPLLQSRNKTVFVRVNRDIADDYKEALECGAEGIVIPCVEEPTHLDHGLEVIAQAGNSSRAALLPTIETPLGLLNINSIARYHQRLAGLMFGAEDFVLRMGHGVSPSEIVLLNAAWQVALVASAYQLPCYGLPGTLAHYQDDDYFRYVCIQAKAIGMVGCPAIHPRQVAIVNQVFTPSQESLDKAAASVEAFERAGFMAVGHRGTMIDYPIYYRAKALLASYSKPVSPDD